MMARGWVGHYYSVDNHAKINNKLIILKKANWEGLKESGEKKKRPIVMLS